MLQNDHRAAASAGDATVAQSASQKSEHGPYQSRVTAGDRPGHQTQMSAACRSAQRRLLDRCGLPLGWSPSGVTPLGARRERRMRAPGRRPAIATPHVGPARHDQNRIDPGPRNQHGEPPQEFDRIRHQMRRPVRPRVPQFEPHLTVRCEAQPILRNGRPQHVTAHTLKALAIARWDADARVEVEATLPRMTAPGRGGVALADRVTTTANGCPRPSTERRHALHGCRRDPGQPGGVLGPPVTCAAVVAVADPPPLPASGSAWQPARTATVVSSDRATNLLTVERVSGERLTYDPSRLLGVTTYQAEERAFPIGDGVQFTAPSTDFHVANRELGTLTALDGESATIRLERGRTVSFRVAEHPLLGFRLRRHESQRAGPNG